MPVAADAHGSMAGTGSAEYPFEIETAEQLQAIESDLDAHYVIVDDIDASSIGTFDPIAGDHSSSDHDCHGTEFTGTLDGQGHTIVGVTIDGNRYVGLIGCLGSGGTVENVRLTNVDINGKQWVGAIAGRNNGGTITSSSASGKLSGETSWIGGLVGMNHGGATVTKSGAAVDVTAPGSIEFYQGAGGFVGSNRAEITDSYATGDVSVDEMSKVGGFVGENFGDISRSFSAGAVDGGPDTGGFAGHHRSGATIENSYFDHEASGLATLSGVGNTWLRGVTALDTDEMTGVAAAEHMTAIALFSDMYPSTTYPVQAWEFEFDPALLNGNGTSEDPFEIETIHELQLIELTPDSHVVLVSDLDAGGSAFLSDGVGFTPIGTSEEPFTGSFDGRDHEIEGLFIDRPTEASVGLFGTIGDEATIENVSLTDVDVTGNHSVGGLAGSDETNADGAVQHVSITGSVTGDGHAVGGLIGLTREGMYVNLTVDVDVSAPDGEAVGGVIGRTADGGTFQTIEAAGTVVGGSAVGGIIGNTSSAAITLENARATGNVTAETTVGGLVGVAASDRSAAERLTNVSATGMVRSVANAGDSVGGLIGITNATGGDIVVTRAAAYGDVSAANVSSVGGLVGTTIGDSEFTYVYARGNVTGNEDVGGIVGSTGASSTQFESVYSSGAIDGTSTIGGFAGSQDTTDDLTAVYWDETVGPAEGYGDGTTDAELVGLETEQMQGFAVIGTMDRFEFFDTGGVWFPSTTYPVFDRAHIFDTAGTDTDPHVLESIEDLQFVSADPTASYRLGDDINASDTAAWNDGEGFTPIGTKNEPFEGTFDGAGHEITGLTIDRPAESSVGLFGRIADGSVENLTLTDVTITGGSSTGGLAGWTDGELIDVHVSGTVSGENDTGGIVGSLEGTIRGGSSTSTITVTDADHVGGIVGELRAAGSISNVSASGEVVTNATDAVGGIAGTVNSSANAAIKMANSTIAIDATQGDAVGGMIGESQKGTYTSVWTTGVVTAPDSTSVGGIIGAVSGSATVTDGYVIGEVTGNHSVGGIVGTTGSQSSTFHSLYSASTVSGESAIGGFAGSVGGNDEYRAIYWDRTIGPTAAFGDGTNSWNVVSLETAEMTGANALTSMETFDFFETWIRTDSYPALISTEENGSDSAPFQIETVADLDAINPALEVHYELTTALDVGSEGERSPIGSSETPFAGSFDGMGHSIDGVTITEPNGTSVGLFSTVAANGVVRNVSVTSLSVTGNESVGGLVGTNHGTVEDVVVNGSVQAPNGSQVGGISGTHTGSISGSKAAGNVVGTDTVGGLVGQSNGGVISDSYATGSVSGTTTVGGLAGSIHDSDVSTAFAMVSIPENGSAIDPVIGAESSSTTENLYWDRATTNATNSSFATALNFTAVRGSSSESLLAGFDFVDRWVALDDTYPRVPIEVTESTVALGRSALTPGETTSVTVTLSLVDGTNASATTVASISSANDSIASVDNETIQSHALGETTITASTGPVTGETTLFVTDSGTIPTADDPLEDGKADDEPSTVPAQPTAGSGGSTPSTGSGPSVPHGADDEPIREPSITVSATDDGLRSSIVMQQLRGGESISLRDGPQPLARTETLAIEDISITLNTDRDGNLSVRVFESESDITVSPLAPDVINDDTAGDSSPDVNNSSIDTVGYFDVEHDLDDDIDSALLATSVSATTINARNVSPDELSLYHNDGDGWSTLDSVVIPFDATSYEELVTNGSAISDRASDSASDGMSTHNGSEVTDPEGYLVIGASDGFSTFAVAAEQPTDPSELDTDDDDPSDPIGPRDYLVSVWLVMFTFAIVFALISYFIVASTSRLDCPLWE